MKRDSIEWHEVPAHQIHMHDRLLNWARWCGTGVHEASEESPTWRLYRSTDANQGDGQRYGLRATAVAVDARDAMVVGKAVSFLPEPHRLALHWYYIRPVSPRRACQAIGTTAAGLLRYVLDGRHMLINRRA